MTTFCSRLLSAERSITSRSPHGKCLLTVGFKKLNRCTKPTRICLASTKHNTQRSDEQITLSLLEVFKSEIMYAVF